MLSVNRQYTYYRVCCVQYSKKYHTGGSDMILENSLIKKIGTESLLNNFSVSNFNEAYELLKDIFEGDFGNDTKWVATKAFLLGTLQGRHDERQSRKEHQQYELYNHNVPNCGDSTAVIIKEEKQQMANERTIETITVVEAAHRLKRSPASIQKAMREGTFPIGTCFSTGRQFQYIIPREAFERFLSGEIAGRVLIMDEQTGRYK